MTEKFGRKYERRTSQTHSMKLHKHAVDTVTTWSQSVIGYCTVKLFSILSITDVLLGSEVAFTGA